MQAHKMTSQLREEDKKYCVFVRIKDRETGEIIGQSDGKGIQGVIEYLEEHLDE